MAKKSNIESLQEDYFIGWNFVVSLVTKKKKTGKVFNDKWKIEGMTQNGCMHVIDQKLREQKKELIKIISLECIGCNWMLDNETEQHIDDDVIQKILKDVTFPIPVKIS